MKIALLTLPFINNYGCHIQAWALKNVLEKLGHNVVLLNLQPLGIRTQLFSTSIKKMVAKIINIIPGKIKIYNIDYRIAQLSNFNSFKKANFTLSKKIYSYKGLKKAFLDENCQAIIVGSDQVWRKWKSTTIDPYFLSWLDVDVPKIGYAISYGKDEWNFTDEETIMLKELAKKFQALSMREDSGVDLTKKYFGLDSLHVLDPTMLLDKKDYIQLIRNLSTNNYQKGIFNYILDSTEGKKNIISECSKYMGFSNFEVKPKKEWFEPHENCPASDYTYPPIEEWLSAFNSSDFVITDSFHGTVFSIIFNKPFIVIGNEFRGLSRINSVLKIFSLENRLITNDNVDSALEIVKSPIDWDKVNKQREKWKEKSFNFLKQNLNS